MAEAVEAPLSVATGSQEVLDLEDRRREDQLKRDRDPPIVYRDIDAAAEFEKLSEAVKEWEMTETERNGLEELRAYCGGEGSWVLGDEFLELVARMLAADEAEEPAARVLAALALRDDVSLVLHQDRRLHALMTHAHRIDRRSLPAQRAIALFMCNLFENISSSEWLMYISEWRADDLTLSNIAVTTKVCVHAALSEDPDLRETGTALMYNMAIKEVKTVVFDEVCVELSMALLQLLQAAPGEEHLYRALRSLARLAQHSADVPQLIAMVGPDPAAFRGTSGRVDEQIQSILSRCKRSE